MNPAPFKDPFEAAAAGEPDSPPESPAADDEHESVFETVVALDDDEEAAADAGPAGLDSSLPAEESAAAAGTSANVGLGAGVKDEEEEEEENMDEELSKLPASGDPNNTANMTAILSQFSVEQMNRYESFRRSGFQKSNMKRLLTSITGNQKISIPMTIVVSGIAKMFVGELVEMARVIMTERKDTGPIRPCHIREAYRRLKLDGKVPRRSTSRLFH